MTMIKSEQKYKELKEILNKDNNTIITEALESLREDQPFEGAIGLLAKHYNKSSDISIKRMIEGFMNDLKDQSVRQEVVDEIRKPWKSATISMLVSSCWQSGLDYSGYTNDIVKIYMNGDYVTAIECLTVIEENIGKLGDKEKDEIVRSLQQGPVVSAHEKRELTLELLSLLER
jgi:predicted DNA-binding protein